MDEGESAVGMSESHPHGEKLLATWFFFQIGADNVALPILVITFLLAKTVKRNPTLINMCITWIVAGVSSSLLLYAGKQTGKEPGPALCVLQASLLQGTPPMASLSALALIYTIWLSLSYASEDSDSRTTKYGIYAWLIIPYIGLFAFALAAAIIGTQDLERVSRARRFFYCSINYDPLSNAMALFSSFICLVCIVFEVLIAIRIVRIRRASTKYGNIFPRRGLDMQLIFRLFVFSGYLLVGLVFSVASISKLKSVVPDLFAASIGMGVFLVFGTHPDVLRAWAFWLPARPPPPPPKDLPKVNAPPYHFSPVEREKPISGDQATILSDTETLRDLTHQIQHLPGLTGSPGYSPDASGHATPMSRASLMSRKGDSVIIIGKPDEAFGAMSSNRHNSV